MATTYTLTSARAMLGQAREQLAAVARAMRDIEQLAAAVRDGRAGPGAVAEAKALEARADEALGFFRSRRILVASIEPGCLDFPAQARHNGQRLEVLLCWQQGDDTVAYFHLPQQSTAERLPVAMLDEV